MAAKLRVMLSLAAGRQNVHHNNLTRWSEKKNFAMKLNTRAQTAQHPHNNSPIVLVHGLFGSLDNLGVLARDLVQDHDVLQVDMRNHGVSPRSPEMNYPAMAQDLLDTLDAHHIEKATFIGHSMGGKAVMALTSLAPDRIDRLVAIDMAPVDYKVRRHDEIFAAINAVSEANVSSRQQGLELTAPIRGNMVKADKLKHRRAMAELSVPAVRTHREPSRSRPDRLRSRYPVRLPAADLPGGTLRIDRFERDRPRYPV